MDARNINIQNQTRLFCSVSNKFTASKNTWSVEQKSLLIESLLIRLPIGHFVFVHNGDCLCGSNRWNAMIDFINNDFVLTGMKYILTYEGKAFSDLPESSRRTIEQTMLNINIVMYPTHDILNDLKERFK